MTEKNQFISYPHAHNAFVLPLWLHFAGFHCLLEPQEENGSLHVFSVMVKAILLHTETVVHVRLCEKSDGVLN